jgi:hypothetical protein
MRGWGIKMFQEAFSYDMVPLLPGYSEILPRNAIVVPGSAGTLFSMCR